MKYCIERLLRGLLRLSVGIFSLGSVFSHFPVSPVPIRNLGILTMLQLDKVVAVEVELAATVVRNRG